MRKIIFILFMLLAATSIRAGQIEDTFQQAQEAYNAGNFLQAADLFNMVGDMLAQNRDARASQIWGNAAIMYMKGEKYDRAASTIERILASSKKMPPAQALPLYNDLAFAYGKLGQNAQVVDAIDRLLRIAPKLPAKDLAALYAMQGDSYKHLELYNLASQSYEKALKNLAPNTDPLYRAELLSSLGMCQNNVGQLVSATRSLTEALKLAEKSGKAQTIADAKSNLGLVYWDQSDYPQAFKLLSEALKVEKDAALRAKEGTDLNNLGLVYKSMGQFEKAFEHIEKSLQAFKDVKDINGQATAIVNRALLNRITGQLKEAHADYSEALKLFEQCAYQEGIAEVSLGRGRMAMLVDKNYIKAGEDFNKALEIYRKLEMPRGQIQALVNLGTLYKMISAPGSTTRDLVFDDEPTVPPIKKNEALAKSRQYFDEALNLAEKVLAKEHIVSAHQGLGFADYKENKLESALEHYQKAIDIVSNLYVSMKNAEAFGEYMADKEDLYREAQEVAAALYKKTQDKKFLELQMQFDETLRNEIKKASIALANMNFENPKKQALFDNYNRVSKEAEKISLNIRPVPDLPKDATPEQQKQREKAVKDQEEQKKLLDDKNKERDKITREFTGKYPSDSAIMNAAARVDFKTIQDKLQPHQVAIQYIPLNDKLTINVITKNDVKTAEDNETSRKELETIIKDKFLVESIEYFGHEKEGIKPEEHMQNVNTAMETLYGKLISKIKDYLPPPRDEQKEKEPGYKTPQLIVINDGFLAQVPFAALRLKDGDKYKYLIEDYDISYIRPSFFSVIKKPDPKGAVNKLLAVANPHNENYEMKPLDGSLREVNDVTSLLANTPLKKDIGADFKKGKMGNKVDYTPEEISAFGHLKNTTKPTESWFRKKMAEPYEIVYFATHGMPQSNTYWGYKEYEKVEKKGKLKDFGRKAMLTTKNFKSNSPFNGFLLLNSEEGDDVTKGPIPYERDGLLTIGEIIGLDEEKFAGTKYIILSACNTGVTFVPAAILDEELYKELEDAFEKPENNLKDRSNKGLIPGIDQIGFVDSFMNRGANNVYGTLWFVDDVASSELMKEFMKNLVEQGNNPNAVAAYSKAQRDFLKAARDGNKKYNGEVYEDKRDHTHPYFWAPGAMFGK